MNAYRNANIARMRAATGHGCQKAHSHQSLACALAHGGQSKFHAAVSFQSIDAATTLELAMAMSHQG